MSKIRNPDVIIPPNHPNPPEKHEVEVAWILARHFNTVVEFLIPVNNYGRKSQDIVLLGVICEIKSPKGNSKKHTIKGQFDRANHQQTKVLILDGRHTKLEDNYILAKIKNELKHRRRIKRVIFINKQEKVVDISR
jgi:hypothetical protein